ncbi:SMP-30/gluconolactonase/LRE family protein [Sphingobacterium faecium]|jgi:sugar lactone lactonase YvrE|uniref:SMP-30/gluconolactonase/LRE family protein n=2 Tax=Sphingobacterium TaxID=28453 RepID=UPI000A07C8BB
MKTICFYIIRSMARLHTGVLICMTLALWGCSKDERKDMIYPDKNSTAKITQYTPISGGSSTELSLYGINFGTDLDQIKVTVNDKEGTVLSSNGRIIVVRVPQNAGSGKVKLKLRDQEYTYKQDFEYGYQTVVYTFLGSTKLDEDGDFSQAKLSGPRYLKWSSDNALYFVEEGASSADNYAAVRVAANNKVTTLLKASESTLVERLRAFDFSKDQSTVYLTNDNNANGSMGFGKMNKSGDKLTNLTALSVTAGLTAVAVNPATDEVFVGIYSGGKVARLMPDGSLEPVFVVNSKNVNIMDMIFSKDGKTMYLSAAYNAHSIYRVSYDTNTKTFGSISVLAGPDANTTGNATGSGTAARFNTPGQMDVDTEGNLYVADRKNHCIRKITPQGAVSTYAGVAGTSGLQNGNALTAKFYDPEGCKFGPDGALYIADTWNHVIRKIVVE